MKFPIRKISALRPGVITPRMAIAAGFLVCAVSLCLLTPSRTKLFERHMADGDARSAALLVAEGECENEETTAALIAETIRICERDRWKGSSLNMLTSFLRQNRNPGSAARETLRHVDKMPTAARAAVMGALVDRALSDGDLRAAQQLQVRLVESSEYLTPEIVRQAVTTYRYNSNPALALVIIDELEKQRGSLPDDLRELRVTLALETSQPEVAFALLNQRVRATDDPEALRTLIPEAVRTGVEAGRQNELIPLYEKYLQIVKSSGGASGSLIAEYAMKLAQACEWTKQPSRAFDVYVELAAQGNREALERCLALNPGLFRQDEIVQALLAGYAHYREDDQLLLLTARYLGEGALREESIRCYLEYLARHPDDAEAHFRVGAVYDEALQLENALKHFKRAHELDPENNSYLSKLARLCTTLHLYDEALGYLRTLSRRTRARDDVEQFYTLADGLGDLAATKEALRLLIDLGGRLSSSNYLYLASAYLEEGYLAGYLQVLQEALARHPKNPFIRLELGNGHLLDKRPDRALNVLKGANLAHYPQGAEVGLNALVALAHTPYAGSANAYLRHFGGQLEASEDLSPGEVLQFAEFCQQHGETSRARRLFLRVIEEASDPGYLGRARYQLGQYRAACASQLQHIRAASVITSDDYQLLGDIHTKLGDGPQARSAYQKALALLKRRTAQPRNR